MSIRKLKQEDVEIITTFWWKLQKMNSSFDDRYYEINSEEEAMNFKKNYYESLIDNTSFYPIVIELEEKLIGYVITEVIKREEFYKKPKIARIQEAFLEPKYQGKGFFIKAYQKIIDFLKKEDIKLIETEMDLSNPALARYYKVNLYKRAFKLISWVKDAEEFITKSLEKKQKKAERKKE